MIDRWIPELPGLHFQKNDTQKDDRGSFTRFLEIHESPLPKKYLSVALSKNPAVGTLRGLHFQNAPFAEEKSIMCVRGSIFEVFVDLRRNLDSYGCWTHRTMSEGDSTIALAPRGLAHGYQTLEDDTWVLYGLTAPFSANHAQRISYQDSTLAIDWPIPVTRVSNSDANGLSWIECDEQGFNFNNEFGRL